MKRLIVSVTAEEERDLPPMLIHIASKLKVLRSMGLKECPLISATGFIYWQIEDSKEHDMTNFTLLDTEKWV